MTTTELTSTLRELKELKLMAAETASEIETLEDRIKSEMAARNTDELIVDVFKVRWTTMTSQRFDSSSFKRTHADLYQQYTNLVEARRFSIKLRGAASWTCIKSSLTA